MNDGKFHRPLPGSPRPLFITSSTKRPRNPTWGNIYIWSYSPQKKTYDEFNTTQFSFLAGTCHLKISKGYICLRPDSLRSSYRGICRGMEVFLDRDNNRIPRIATHEIRNLCGGKFEGRAKEQCSRRPLPGPWLSLFSLIEVVVSVPPLAPSGSPIHYCQSFPLDLAGMICRPFFAPAF